MKVIHWIVEEIKSILVVTVYFAFCFTLVMVLKQLLLAGYGIAFSGITTAIVVALVTAKVVVVLQKVPLSRLYDGQPGVIDVIARTLLYTFATLVALLLEKAFEARGEYGGFIRATVEIFEHRDIAQVWATTICIGLAFIVYNTFGVIFETLGREEIRRVFFQRRARPA